MKSFKSKILVSSCLLGYKTRYDGSDKLDDDILKLQDLYELIPICPEIEAGLFSPRNPAELFRKLPNIFSLKFIDLKTQKDYTSDLEKFFKKIYPSLNGESIVGAILKSRSPSCGVYDAALHFLGIKWRRPGLFVRFLKKNFPKFALISEKDFKNPRKRDAFFRKLG